MSRLEELIAGLCPDGVEYRKIKNVFTRLRGTPITAGKMKEIEDPDGDIRIFAGGKTVINAMEKDIPNANIIRVPAVLVQSRGVIDAVYYDKPFTFKNEMWAYTADNQLSVKYLYYVLKNNVEFFRTAASGMGSLPQISLPVTEEFIIPVPPLEIQREIVRILDNFTELTAELTARKKQYEYYRNSMLSFDATVDVFELKDITIIKTGTKPEEIKDDNTDAEYEYINAGTTCSGYVKHSNCGGNMVTTPSRGQGGIGFIGYQSNPFWLGPLCYRISSTDKNRLSNKYLYYCLSNQTEDILARKKEGGVPALNASDLGTVKIAVPKIQVQERIVRVLDSFETICADINIGLPAEIEARQKQYEYYRDKLLTFKEKKEA